VDSIVQKINNIEDFQKHHKIQKLHWNCQDFQNRNSCCHKFIQKNNSITSIWLISWFAPASCRSGGHPYATSRSKPPCGHLNGNLNYPSLNTDPGTSNIVNTDHTSIYQVTHGSYSLQPSGQLFSGEKMIWVVILSPADHIFWHPPP
jgi:hypothetical protein